MESLKKTLRKNLNDNLTERQYVEFILMDFDESPEVKNWIEDEFQSFLIDGYLKYYHCPHLNEWHAPIAKNTSHKAGKGTVLVNLDCDNYTGLQGGAFVWSHFQKANHSIVLWQFSKTKKDGSFGRIAMTKDLFDSLGGYDETFLPMGYQDNDLIKRAVAGGAKLVHDKNKVYNRAIPNEKYQPKNMTYHKMKMSNKLVSKKNISKGQLTANGGQYGLEYREPIIQDTLSSAFIKLQLPL